MNKKMNSNYKPVNPDFLPERTSQRQQQTLEQNSLLPQMFTKARPHSWDISRIMKKTKSIEKNLFSQAHVKQSLGWVSD